MTSGEAASTLIIASNNKFESPFRKRASDGLDIFECQFHRSPVARAFVIIKFVFKMVQLLLFSINHTHDWDSVLLPLTGRLRLMKESGGDFGRLLLSRK